MKNCAAERGADGAARHPYQTRENSPSGFGVHALAYLPYIFTAAKTFTACSA